MLWIKAQALLHKAAAVTAVLALYWSALTTSPPDTVEHVSISRGRMGW
jgi:hypothetical protein